MLINPTTSVGGSMAPLVPAFESAVQTTLKAAAARKCVACGK